MKSLIFPSSLLVILCLDSCRKDHVQVLNGGYWHRIDEAQYPGLQRAGMVAFTIGSRAYVGLGYNDVTYENDFYVYDVTKGYWTGAIAPFPGVGRQGAIAFSIGTKGYVGTGFQENSDLSQTYFKDFWEFDPKTDHWKRLNDFGGGARGGAVAFVDDTHGYVGAGRDSSFLGDYWQYNPIQDSWSEIVTYAGAARTGALSISIKGNTYIFSGFGGDFIYDLWKFDPSALAAGKNPWNDITPPQNSSSYGNFKLAVGRSYAVAFALGDKGYISTGFNGAELLSTFEFDPVQLSWRLMANFDGLPRLMAIAFVLGTDTLSFRAFVGTGAFDGSTFNDISEFNFTP